MERFQSVAAVFTAVILFGSAIRGSQGADTFSNMPLQAPKIKLESRDICEK